MMVLYPVECIREQFYVVVARTVQELNGMAFLDLENIAPDKQQIVSSRSFNLPLTYYRELCEALAKFCTRAAEKLRQQNVVAGHLSVFIRTNPFQPNEPQYQRASGLMLSTATQDNRVIIHQAHRVLKQLFRVGYRYQKCCIQLSQIQPVAWSEELDLFEVAGQPDSIKLMQTVDRINRCYPKGIAIAAAGFDKSWQPKGERLSPRYTTDWSELVKVKYSWTLNIKESNRINAADLFYQQPYLNQLMGFYCY